MRIDYLNPDILLFRGDSLAATATAFIDGNRVLLIDALASEYDALEMRDYLERDHGLQVASILLTRTGKAQEAGLHVFPAADISVASASAAPLTWGRHRLTFFHTPGDAARALAIEAVSGADTKLLFVRDRVVGSVALLGESTPEQADSALASLEQRGAARIVPAMQGAQDAQDLAAARIYLARLQELVLRVRATAAPDQLKAAILAIAIDDCLAPGMHAGALERHWHGDNLARVVQRGLFPVAASRLAGPALKRALNLNAVATMLVCMLGRLGRSGV